MAEKRADFKSGADRNSLTWGLEERIQANDSFYRKGPTISFQAQKGTGVDFFSYGGTRAELDGTVKKGNTTGANRYRTTNEVHDATAQVDATIYRTGPDGKVNANSTEVGVNFMADGGSGGTPGFRQHQGYDNIAKYNGHATEYNPEKTVFRKAMPAPGGYSAPGVDSSSGRGPGSDFMSNQKGSGKNLMGFTRRADQVNISDFGANDPLKAAQASVYRNYMDTTRYETSFSMSEISQSGSRTGVF
jgi:hypothetical protein